MTSSSHWTKYWDQGFKTSFGDHFDNLYSGEIREFWSSQFQSIGNDSRVLDLCTGNASLIRLALEEANCKNSVFTGVDFADILVDQDLKKLDNVNLIFNKNIEKLPFENESFDYVISNYGIEYSSIEDSIKETDRVLCKSGKVVILAHCIDSHIVELNGKELDFINELLRDDGVITRLQQMIEALSDDDNPLEARENARNRLNDSLKNVSEKHEEMVGISDFSAFLKFLLNKNTTDKLHRLAEYTESIIDHHARLSALLNAALNQNTQKLIRTALLELGFSEQQNEPLESKFGAIGHIFIFQKN